METQSQNEPIKEETSGMKPLEDEEKPEQNEEMLKEEEKKVRTVKKVKTKKKPRRDFNTVNNSPARINDVKQTEDARLYGKEMIRMEIISNVKRTKVLISFYRS